MLSVQDLMNRPGEPDVEELMARIAALQAENPPLAAGVVKLEEELALARLHRFAPKSERHIDRLFNEAERAADEDDADSEDGDVVVLPDTDFPATEGATGKKRGRKPLPEHLPRERVEYDHADDQKACPCCRHQMHRMGETVTEQLHIEVKTKGAQQSRCTSDAVYMAATDLFTGTDRILDSQEPSIQGLKSGL